jgi:putative ABC transport system permease protein
VAEPRLRMNLRLLRGALWQRRAISGLAVLAVAIGASVASALLHVSSDVARKLTRELRSLGPNLLVLPEQDGSRFLSESEARTRLAVAGVEGAALLYVVAESGGRTVPVIGAALEVARRLHPSWTLTAAPGTSQEQARTWMGARLMDRLGVQPGDRLAISFPANGRTLELPIDGVLDAGGPDDEAWWIPLADAQALSDLADRVSLVQVRVDGDASTARGLAALLESAGTLSARPLLSLTTVEARLLDRMRRLMTLVTVAAMLAAGLCAFGSLTDLALERRREIALLKALGATPVEVVRQFAAEAAAIGIVGGACGWLFGLIMAEVIGREVFHSSVSPQWTVPVIVIALSLAVSALASYGPVRLALRIEPAVALKGD